MVAPAGALYVSVFAPVTDQSWVIGATYTVDQVNDEAFAVVQLAAPIDVAVQELNRLSEAEVMS